MRRNAAPAAAGAPLPPYAPAPPAWPPPSQEEQQDEAAAAAALAISDRRTLYLVNIFLGSAARFLNSFAAVCEDKLADVHRRILRLDSTLRLLEAKLSGTSKSGDGEGGCPEQEQPQCSPSSPPPPPRHPPDQLDTSSTDSPTTGAEARKVLGIIKSGWDDYPVLVWMIAATASVQQALPI
uniref:WASH complex subunit CCDC53 n=2 Tax=Anthurium amnicola TaxID=1678845 RepID=A0A1D1XFF7_9ARAE